MTENPQLFEPLPIPQTGHFVIPFHNLINGAAQSEQSAYKSQWPLNFLEKLTEAAEWRTAVRDALQALTKVEEIRDAILNYLPYVEGLSTIPINAADIWWSQPVFQWSSMFHKEKLQSFNVNHERIMLYFVLGFLYYNLGYVHQFQNYKLAEDQLITARRAWSTVMDSDTEKQIVDYDTLRALRALAHAQRMQVQIKTTVPNENNNELFAAKHWTAYKSFEFAEQRLKSYEKLHNMCGAFKEYHRAYTMHYLNYHTRAHNTIRQTCSNGILGFKADKSWWCKKLFADAKKELSHIFQGIHVPTEEEIVKTIQELDTKTKSNGMYHTQTTPDQLSLKSLKPAFYWGQ